MAKRKNILDCILYKIYYTVNFNEFFNFNCWSYFIWNFYYYQEWFHKVKNTLIFNDMWDGICENENLEDKKDGEAIDEVDKSALVPPTNAKDLAIWKIKDKTAH